MNSDKRGENAREKERLRWQCRRGMLELDCLFLDFLEQKYDLLTNERQAAFSRLLQESDPHLFRWLLENPLEAPADYRELIVVIRDKR